MVGEIPLRQCHPPLEFRGCNFTFVDYYNRLSRLDKTHLQESIHHQPHNSNDHNRGADQNPTAKPFFPFRDRDVLSI